MTSVSRFPFITYVGFLLSHFLGFILLHLLILFPLLRLLHQLLTCVTVVKMINSVMATKRTDDFISVWKEL